MEIQGSQRTLWLMALAGLVLGSLCALIIPARPLYGWAGVLIFGGTLIVALKSIRQGTPVITLSPDGLQIETIFKTHFARWEQITEIRTRRIRGHLMVLVTVQTARGTVTSTAQLPRYRQMVIADIYQAPVEGIFATLQAWHQLYGGVQS